MSDLTSLNAAHAVHLAVDADKPVAWEGTAADHIVMIQFDNARSRGTDEFKSFDADMHRSPEATIQIAREMGGQRRGRGLDPKAFEANVKDYDQMLNNRLHSVCKGC